MGDESPRKGTFAGHQLFNEPFLMKGPSSGNQTGNPNQAECQAQDNSTHHTVAAAIAAVAVISCQQHVAYDEERQKVQVGGGKM